MASPQATKDPVLLLLVVDEDVTMAPSVNILLESGERPGERPGAIGMGKGSVRTLATGLVVLKIWAPEGVVGQRMNNPP